MLKNLYDGQYISKEKFEEFKEKYAVEYFGECEDGTESYTVYIDDEEFEVYV